MIYNQPFPTCGFDSVHKSDVERILRCAEARDKGFCERHGIEFDGQFLPAGKKVDHQKLVRRLWPQISVDIKRDFLTAQCMGAVLYLTNSISAFVVSEIEVPPELTAILEDPLLFGTQALNAARTDDEDEDEITDPAQFVADYRAVCELRDSAPNDMARAEFQAIIERLRARWREWNGGDDSELHKTAFGGPPEE